MERQRERDRDREGEVRRVKCHMHYIQQWLARDRWRDKEEERGREREFVCVFVIERESWVSTHLHNVP